ncbi:MAG: YbaK/EbsC family protein [Patescibacteria group bacterium]|nr:YbaK/EbsC family protein [Patescibacteria group bacterium]
MPIKKKKTTIKKKAIKKKITPKKKIVKIKKKPIKKVNKKVKIKKQVKRVGNKKSKVKMPKTKISDKLIKILNEHKIKYEIKEHKTVFTAYDLAQTLKIKPKEITKTLVIKADKNYILVVLGGDQKLDFTKLKKIIGAKKVSIATEKDMVKQFKIKPGAITPFGILYKTPVYLEKKLIQNPKLLLQSGNFNQSLRLTTKDFVKLIEPVSGSFGIKK